MPRFSRSSKEKLNTCHNDLKNIFNIVIGSFDCTILQGHRGKEDQDLAFNSGNSKVQYPNSKHNKFPSIAVDVSPYPINWNDTERFCFFAGYVKGVAETNGYRIRWGGDWDGDTELKDNSFDDLVHFELRK